MVILATFIILFVVIYKKRFLQQQNEIQEAKYIYQRELLEATIQVEEKERERIAKNIHDDLGTLLNVMRLNNISAIKKIHDETALLKVLEDNKNLLNSTSEIVRNISKQLAPPILLKLGYSEGISELCSHINNTEELSVYFTSENITSRFNHKIEIQLYRVTQEIINNIIKHAKASSINIHLVLQNEVLNLSITHNGKGISSSTIEGLLQSPKGLGLKNIQSRVQAINGTVQYFTVGINNSKITIDIPLLNNEKN